MRKLFLSILAIALIQTAQAQKIKWESGDLDVLKGQTEVGVVINYPKDLQVSGTAEAEFLEERRKTDNEEKAASGDLYVENWNKAKETKYIASFCDHFTKASKENIKATAGRGTAKYVIVLTPSNIDLGKGKFFGTKPALVDFDIRIENNTNPAEVAAHGTVEKVKGESTAPKGSRWIPGGVGTVMDVSARSKNFDATNRVSESFELLAVVMGKKMR
ncbi:MAG: hypothetical protein ABI378_14605 [Chitinophagaceae bacterium]